MKYYVLAVNTGQELAVRDALLREGFTAAVPHENRMIRRWGVWQQKEYVLFAGYVFVGIETMTDAVYYTVRSIPAVIRFLGVTAPETISDVEAVQIGLLAPTTEALEPSVVEFDLYGTPRIVSGVLLNLPPTKIDKHSRRATINISQHGKPKQLSLSIAIN